MTTQALPQWSDGLVRDIGARPGAVLLAALAFILVGLAVIAAPDRAGVVLGGTSGWMLWFAGITILAVWMILLLGQRPVKGMMIAGGIAAASGAFLFYNPTTGALAVAILAISALVMDGGIQVALALKLRPAGVWRWLFASALASAVAAILVSGGGFADTAPDWGPLMAMALISSGLVLALLSWTAREAGTAPD